MFGGFGEPTVVQAAAAASAPPPAVPPPVPITEDTPLNALPADLQAALQAVNAMLHAHSVSAAAIARRTGHDRTLNDLAGVAASLDSELLGARNALGRLGRDVGTLSADTEDAMAASDDAVTRARVGTMGGGGSYELPLPSPFLSRFVDGAEARAAGLLRDIGVAEEALLPHRGGGGGGGGSRGPSAVGPRPSSDQLKAILVASSGALVRVAGGPSAHLHEAVADLRGMLLRALNNDAALAASGGSSSGSNSGWRPPKYADPFKDADDAEAAARRRAANDRSLQAAVAAPAAGGGSPPATATPAGFAFGVPPPVAPAPAAGFGGFGAAFGQQAAPASAAAPSGFAGFGVPAPAAAAPTSLWGAPAVDLAKPPALKLDTGAVGFGGGAAGAGGFAGFSTPVGAAAGSGGFGAASGGGTRMKARRK